mgnify:CR=1 FL=1
MILKGNIRKMIASPASTYGGRVGYQFQMFDVLDQLPTVDMIDWVGNCVVSGEPMKQAYRMGMSQKAFFESPISCPSIINPELSTIHTGVVLRDREFEERYHNVPHIVYLSRTNQLKVGVTGYGREQFRWNDQGAVEGIILCITPYRQLAGEIEVALKEYINDKTYWLGMLKDVSRNPDELLELKDECFDILGMNYEPFFSDDDTVHAIHYPVEHYPSKVMSIKLAKSPEGSGVLSGIKGQYLIFKDGRVMNVRAHEGCRVELEVG